MGQGAKPGIGGHLARPQGQSGYLAHPHDPRGYRTPFRPAPHHDIYSIEDLRQLVFRSRKQPRTKSRCWSRSRPCITWRPSPRAWRAAARTSFASTATVAARARPRLASATTSASRSSSRLRRSTSACATRASATRFRSWSAAPSATRPTPSKAIALGADACYIATSALLALGCHLCRTCQTGQCNWGIATQRPELVKRLNPDIGSQRLVNLVTAWDA